MKHWTALASDAELATYLWVAVKHEITYRRPAFFGGVLRATVMATGFQGARAMFDTVIRRGDLIIAEIESVWCCLDTASKRPKRAAQDVVRRFSAELQIA